MASFPYDTSWCLSDLFYTWMFPAIKFYNQNPPSTSNLFQVPHKCSLRKSLKILKKNWEAEQKNPKPSFPKAFFKTIIWEFSVCFFILLIAMLLILFQSVLIYLLVDYLENRSERFTQGVVSTIFFILISILIPCFRHNGSLRMLILTGKIKNLVVMLVSEKIVRLHNSLTLEENIRGKIINVMSTDMEILELCLYIMYFLSAPFVIIVSIVLIMTLFGPAGLVGVAVSVLHAPLVLWMGKLTMKIRLQASRVGDSRIKMIQNLIEGIKIMKLYSWEVPLLKAIFSVRINEITILKKLSYINSITGIMNVFGYALVIYSSMLVQIAQGEQMSAGKVFMLIGFYSTTHMTIAYATATGANTLFSFIAIMHRVSEVLLLKENNSAIEDCSSSKYSMELKNATIAWREPESYNQPSDVNLSKNRLLGSKTTIKACLKDITMKIRHGELVMVVGPVGSGKSSLFMGLLREIFIQNGTIKKNGRISYASEEPWIKAGSVKDNVLMGKNYNPALYQLAVGSSDLFKDFTSFKNWDETLVGDRGFTLSGGQRARICLARTVYDDADIVMLDDPLSAVDAEVANHLFHECFKGALKGRTIILATHQVHFLPQADKVVVLNGGSLMFFGSYEELKNHDEARKLLGDLAFREGEGEVKVEEKKVKVKKKKFNVEDMKFKVEKMKDTANNNDSNEKLLIEEEEITEGTTSFRLYMKYALFGFKTWIFLLIVILFMTISQVSYISTLYWISYWSKAQDQGNVFYIEVYGILLLILYALCCLRTFPFITTFITSNVILHNEALKNLALTSSVFFDKNPTGRLINRFSKDVGVADGPLQHYLYDCASTTLIIIGNLITVIVILPINLALLPIIIVLWLVLLKYVVPITLRLRKIELIARGPLLSSITSAINGLPTLRALGLQKSFIKETAKHAKDHYSSYLTFHVSMRFVQFIADVISNFVMVLNVILIVTVEGYVAPNIAAFSLSSAVGLLGISSLWSKNMVELNSNMASAQRLLEFANLPAEGTLEQNYEFSITKGSIVFDSVCMRYRPNFDLVLNKLSFSISPGLKVGIVGRTGSGKSSILQVLFRLVNPESGTIYIDGQDYMKAGLHELRGQMSVIPQSSVLFTGSVKDNLDPFHKHTEKELLKVLKEVKLKNYIMGYDNGINTEISGEGVSFSAGQKQLLCLARAILRNNKIVMMDEATANVDNETDRLIQEKVKEKFNECTLLIIAHRLRTIVDSDRVLVVDKGRCGQFGTPKEIYEEEGSMFKAMVLSTGPEESQYLLNQINLQITKDS